MPLGGVILLKGYLILDTSLIRQFYTNKGLALNNTLILPMLSTMQGSSTLWPSAIRKVLDWLLILGMADGKAGDSVSW